MITVLLVDDYPIIRRLARQILERHSDIRVIGEADTGEEAVAQVARLKPAVVVIDIQLPNMTGIQATTVIKRESPTTTVIGLTAGALDSIEMAMRDAGAATVLNKENLLDSLYPTIIEEGMVGKISSRLRPSEFDQRYMENYMVLLETTYKDWKRLHDPPSEEYAVEYSVIRYLFPYSASGICFEQFEPFTALLSVNQRSTGTG